jgi:hypothetical protein
MTTKSNYKSKGNSNFNSNRRSFDFAQDDIVLLLRYFGSGFDSGQDLRS